MAAAAVPRVDKSGAAVAADVTAPTPTPPPARPDRLGLEEVELYWGKGDCA